MKNTQALVEASHRKAQQLQEELVRANEEWESQYEEAVRKMRARVGELSSQQNLEQIEKLVHQLKEKDALLQELLHGINDMKSELRKIGGSDEELKRAKREFEEQWRQYHRALNEKAILFDSMYVAARQLINRDELIVKNEQEIIRTKYDIDLSKLELE
jgi:Zn-dependent oligopeptidase